MFGINTAIAGAKVAGFFGNWWVRVIGVLLVAVLFVFSLHQLIDGFQARERRIHDDGFAAGIATEKARWEREAAFNARMQRDQVVADVKQQNQAVWNYMADIAAKAPKVIQVEKEVIRYAQSPAGSVQCLDDVGVRLIREGREAIDLIGQTGPAPGAPGPVHGSVRQEHAAPPVQR